MFGKCRRIKYDDVVFSPGLIQKPESVFGKRLMIGNFGKIYLNIPVGQIDGFGRTVHRMDQSCTTTECIYRESSGVAKHIQYVFPPSIGFEQAPAVTLINKETGFLTLQPVNAKFQSIFYSFESVA